MLRFWDVRWFTKGVLAVALVGLAACSENQNPLGVQPPSFALSDPTGNAKFPWTGRSGSAAITAYALFGTSATNLTVTSYREADTLFTTPVGCLDKIQVKVYDTQGRLASTQNFNKLNAGNVATVQVRGAQVGYRLELHVNVSCIDPKRTDVVTMEMERYVMALAVMSKGAETWNGLGERKHAAIQGCAVAHERCPGGGSGGLGGLIGAAEPAWPAELRVVRPDGEPDKPLDGSFGYGRDHGVCALRQRRR